MEARSDRTEQHDAELRELVDRTEGLQPWRRLFHAANGCLIVAALELDILTWDQMVLLLGGALLGALAVDIARLRIHSVQRFFFRSFSALASPREARGIASSTWYVAGSVLALLLFPVKVAEASILVLALGDPAASYVGRRWGRIRFGDGSVRGTAVFLLVALAVLLAFFPAKFAVAGALVATVVERIPWGVDDNFTLPVGTGAALLLLSHFIAV